VSCFSLLLDSEAFVPYNLYLITYQFACHQRTFGHEINKKMEKFLEYNDHERKSVGHGLGAYVMLSLILLLTLVAKKQRIRLTGRHKKKDEATTPLTSSGFSKKYRDS